MTDASLVLLRPGTVATWVAVLALSVGGEQALASPVEPSTRPATTGEDAGVVAPDAILRHARRPHAALAVGDASAAA